MSQCSRRPSNLRSTCKKLTRFVPERAVPWAHSRMSWGKTEIGRYLLARERHYVWHWPLPFTRTHTIRFQIEICPCEYAGSVESGRRPDESIFNRAGCIAQKTSCLASSSLSRLWLIHTAVLIISVQSSRTVELRRNVYSCSSTTMSNYHNDRRILPVCETITHYFSAVGKCTRNRWSMRPSEVTQH